MKITGICMMISGWMLFLSGCCKPCLGPISSETYREERSATAATDSVIRIARDVERVYVRDSVATTTRGDTVVIEKFRDRWHYREQSDSLQSSSRKTKTVARTVTVKETHVVYRDKKMSLPEKIKTGLAVLIVTGMTVIIVWVTIKYKRHTI